MQFRNLSGITTNTFHIGGPTKPAIRQDSGVPDDSFGNNGDVYIRTDSPEFYFKRGGEWVLISDEDLITIAGLSQSNNAVIKSNGTNWTSAVLSANDLGDVEIVSANSGDILFYDGTNFTNSPKGSTSGVQGWDSDLDTIASLSHGTANVIRSNGTVWQSTKLSLNDINSVATSSLTAGDILYFDGTNFVNDAAGSTSGVQAWDSDLDTIAALSHSDGNFIVSNGTTWTVESGNTARTSLGLGTGDSPTFTAVNTQTILRGSEGNASLYTDIGENDLTIGHTDSTVIIAGNLQIDGTTTFVNSTNLDVTDKNITVNKNGNTAGATASGINIEGNSGAVVGYFRSASDNANLEFKAPTGSILTLDINSNSTIQINSSAEGETLRYNGTQFVNGLLSLDDLSDVAVSGAVSGNILYHNGTNFINSAPGATSGVQPYDSDLVTIAGLTHTSGNTIRSNGTVWQSTTLSFNDLGDVIITTPSAGHVIYNDGTNWVNAAKGSVSGVQAWDADLDTIAGLSHGTANVIRSNGTVWQSQKLTFSGTDLTGLSLSSPVEHDVLKYNGTNWINDANITPKVYNNSGRIVNGVKIWAGNGTTAGGDGEFSADISSAGFSSVISVSAIPRNNTTTLTDFNLASIRSVSTSAVVGRIVNSAGILLGGQGLQFGPNGIVVDVIVIGT